MSLWLRGLAPLPLSVTPSVPTSAYVPGTSKAPVPGGAEAVAGTPGQHQFEQLATPARLP